LQLRRFPGPETLSRVMPASLPVRRLLLALVIVTIWGSNFVAIKLALQDLPPLLLCALRFLFVALPAVFFLKRPAVPLRQLLVYGFSMFAFQFAFMFLGMKLGVSAGLASLILQVQVFFTLGLAVVFLKETVSFPQIAGTLLALAGFVVVGRNTGGDITAAGFACLLLAGASWAVGNLTSKRLGPVNPLALVAWASLPVFGAMTLASLVFEGPTLIVHSLTHVGLTAVLATAYTVVLSTHVAYSLWSWLLARHPATTITPFALMVPVVGMLTSALFLGEPLPGWKLAAAALVIAGLSLTVFGPTLVRLYRPVNPATES
jgi:O-acetylserine/cysteine efflux transporter